MDAFLQQVWVARWALLDGAWLTVQISTVSIVAGTVFGVLVGLVLTYGGRALRWPTRLYVDFIRGTPVLVLVLAAFYVLSVIGIQLTAVQAGIFALAVFCSSHVGEIVRGALQAIPLGQTEAAKSLGLTFRQTVILVLLPQALRQILPSWVNTGTEMVKASTLLSVIGVTELLLATKEVISRNYMSLQFYLLAAAIYFVVNFAIERLGKTLSRRVALR
ncbi:amino acid ABC transporter permease [Inquilinus sp.]|jgi:polar amino acid transport system permease protein|uniref:amino acid ABC transporter permease n=1 Tax=Inquilinus sp. TaxID=1932117 RepID=UPI00378417B5